MAKKEENKDLMESPEALKSKLVGFEYYLETHPKIIFGILGVIVLVVGGYFGYNRWVSSQDEAAQKEMFQAVRYFEADSLNLALNGNGNTLGFLQIISEFGMTDAAKLANFYTGVIYMKKANYKSAILYLEDFKSDDLLIQARAYSLIGDAYMEQKDFENAAKFYSQAANYKPNKFFSPTYLMKAALAYEKLNQNDKAKDAYQTIIDKFWDSNEFQDARKFKARLESNS